MKLLLLSFAIWWPGSSPRIVPTKSWTALGFLPEMPSVEALVGWRVRLTLAGATAWDGTKGSICWSRPIPCESLLGSALHQPAPKTRPWPRTSSLSAMIPNPECLPYGTQQWATTWWTRDSKGRSGTNFGITIIEPRWFAHPKETADDEEGDRSSSQRTTSTPTAGSWKGFHTCCSGLFLTAKLLATRLAPCQKQTVSRNPCPLIARGSCPRSRRPIHAPYPL